MMVYVVTGKSQEEDSVGKILRVDVTVFGVFSDRGRADEIADKHNGEVNAFALDLESQVRVEHWENPGYVQ